MCGRGGRKAATDNCNPEVFVKIELEATQDIEGLQTMRVLARNMTFLMKSIALGKEKYGLPEKEKWQPTHFIR